MEWEEEEEEVELGVVVAVVVVAITAWELDLAWGWGWGLVLVWEALEQIMSLSRAMPTTLRLDRPKIYQQLGEESPSNYPV